MAIALTCDCGRSLRVKDELAGRKVRCPECRDVLDVPEPARDWDAADEILDALPAESGRGSRSPGRGGVSVEDTPRRRTRRSGEDGYDLAPEEPPFRGGYADEDEDDRPRRTRRRRYEDEEEEDEDEAEPRARKRSLSVPQMDGLVKAGFWGVLVLVALVSVGTWYAVRTARRAPFRAQMASYLAAPTGVANPNAPRQGPRKMVVVDVQDKDVDDLHFNLPDDLRAATPDEVNTVVQLRWNQAAVGTYSSGGKGYQWSCSATVIDRATQTTINSQQFTGAPPPPTFYGKPGESRSGDKPTDQVLGYLRGLARS